MSMQTTIEQVDGAVPITILALDGELDASNFRSSSTPSGACMTKARGS